MWQALESGIFYSCVSVSRDDSEMHKSAAYGLISSKAS